MLKWLRALLGLCTHKWKIIQKDEMFIKGITLSVGDRYVLQCEHCGNIKSKKTY